MIAQEILGRPHLVIFGIKATTVVWIFIALGLGFIFSMFAWPCWWKNFFKKLHKKKNGGV
jgi:hypothetical protein